MTVKTRRSLSRRFRAERGVASTVAVWFFLVAGGAPTFAQNTASSPEASQPTSEQSQAERLAGQRREKAQNLTPAQVSSGEARVRGIEKSRLPFSIFQQGFHGFRPVMGGMPSGSGFVLGGGYVRGLESELFTVSADARASFSGFKQGDVRLTFPTAQSGRHVRAHVNASYQDYPGLRFFGLGNNSVAEDKAFFGQKNQIFGGGITAESRWVDVGVDVSRMTIETGPGNRDPSVETVFAVVLDPVEAPLFRRETDFNVVGGYVTFNLLDRYNFPRVGLELTVEGWRYEDRDLKLLSFSKIVGHVRGQIPLGTRNRRLAFQLRTSHSTADSGNTVPVYLMETLGGASTIRGYGEYRFRDTRNLLVNVEYRWEVWTYMDFAFFYDGGKVFSSENDLDFNDLHSGYGFGMHMHAPGEVFFNIDLAKSVEGFKVHIGGGLGF